MYDILNTLHDLILSQQFYISIFISYLLGSIPFGLIITKYFLGFDIRKKGSGNIGMTNVMRTAGKLPGILTFLFDFAKGVFAVWIVLYWVYPEIGEGIVIPAMFAVFGHTKSIFLKFTGGKGVATNFGVWSILDWRIFLGIVGIWVFIFVVKKISSLSALISLLFFPVITFYFKGVSLWFFVSITLSIYMIYLHKKNIQRLLANKEGTLL